MEKLIRAMPREDYLYYADSANTPYFVRSKEEIKLFFDKAVANLMQTSPKVIVVACNIILPQLIEELRSKYAIPIIGMQPAIKPKERKHDPRKILVLTTDVCIQHDQARSMVANLELGDNTNSLSMQKLVDFAEEFDFDSPEVKRYLKSELARIDWESYHSIVLGCTHFLYFKDLMTTLIPEDVIILDGYQETIGRVKSVVEQEYTDRSHSVTCQLSGKEVATEIIMPYMNIAKGCSIQSS